MQLGTKVGLGSCHMVLDGDPAYPRKKRLSSPNFRPISVAAIRLDDQDDTWHGGRPRPVHIVLDGDPAPVHRKGGTASIIMSIASGDTVRWDAAAPKRGTASQFSAPAYWYKGRPSFVPHCVS